MTPIERERVLSRILATVRECVDNPAYQPSQLWATPKQIADIREIAAFVGHVLVGMTPVPDVPPALELDVKPGPEHRHTGHRVSEGRAVCMCGAIHTWGEWVGPAAVSHKDTCLAKQPPLAPATPLTVVEQFFALLCELRGDNKEFTAEVLATIREVFTPPDRPETPEP